LDLSTAEVPPLGCHGLEGRPDAQG
ncbi:hypothetical protein KIPB_015878, partial [Kipferlia bialata]